MKNNSRSSCNLPLHKNPPFNSRNKKRTANLVLSANILTPNFCKTLLTSTDRRIVQNSTTIFPEFRTKHTQLVYTKHTHTHIFVSGLLISRSMRSSAGSGYPNKHLKRCFETMMNDHSQPTMHGLDYEKSKVDHEGLILKLKSSKLQFEVELLEMQISLQRDYKDSDEKHGILRKRLSDDHSKIVYCIDELGLLCAYEAVKICIGDASKAIEECGFFKDSSSKCLHFLEESLSIIENALPNGHENIFDPGCEFEKMVAAGYISPKLYQLVKLLRSFG
ncbi:hypothetical protein Hdeb2414_s0011g00359091 [Helianthus debilis subsp. tardiflorus]